jgi:transcriptional regulator with XRE-family HTH domain
MIFKKMIDLQTVNRIKEVLKEKGLTQTWLASELGKSYNMVNSYVQNRSQPSIELLYDIAELLNVDPRSLLLTKRIRTK